MNKLLEQINCASVENGATRSYIESLGHDISKKNIKNIVKRFEYRLQNNIIDIVADKNIYLLKFLQNTYFDGDALFGEALYGEALYGKALHGEALFSDGANKTIKVFLLQDLEVDKNGTISGQLVHHQLPKNTIDCMTIRAGDGEVIGFVCIVVLDGKQKIHYDMINTDLQYMLFNKRVMRYVKWVNLTFPKEMRYGHLSFVLKKDKYQTIEMEIGGLCGASVYLSHYSYSLRDGNDITIPQMQQYQVQEGLCVEKWKGCNSAGLNIVKNTDHNIRWGFYRSGDKWERCTRCISCPDNGYKMVILGNQLIELNSIEFNAVEPKQHIYGLNQNIIQKINNMERIIGKLDNEISKIVFSDGHNAIEINNITTSQFQQYTVYGAIDHTKFNYESLLALLTMGYWGELYMTGRLSNMMTQCS